jgi:deoxyribonuclease-4
VSGIDVGDPAVLDDALEELDDAVGLDRLRSLHVNDADAELGSNRDRHATMRSGRIGDGLGTFLAHPAFQQLPAILETPGPDGYANELKLLRELHKRGLSRKRD